MSRSQTRRSQCGSKACQPTNLDCLCGKDKTLAKHSGNRLFRQRIDDTRGAYCAAQSKTDKMKITRELVASMQKQGTRFLKQGSNADGEWFEISNQAARDKVSHALRFACRNTEKWQTGKSARAPEKHRPQQVQQQQLKSVPIDIVPIDIMLQPIANDDDDYLTEDCCEFSSSSSSSSFDEPIPLSHVFGAAWNHQPRTQREKQANFARTQKSEGHSCNDLLSSLSLPSVQMPELGQASRPMTRDEDECALHRKLRSPVAFEFSPALKREPHVESLDDLIGDDWANEAAEQFNSQTMRSVDLTDLLAQPLGSEWEEIQNLAKL